MKFPLHVKAARFVFMCAATFSIILIINVLIFIFPAFVMWDLGYVWNVLAHPAVLMLFIRIILLYSLLIGVIDVFDPGRYTALVKTEIKLEELKWFIKRLDT